MEWKDIAVSALRSLSMAAELFGRPKISKYLDGVANLAEAGEDVEEHMRVVNEKLLAREINDDDWADVESRIRVDLDRLNEP